MPICFGCFHVQQVGWQVFGNERFGLNVRLFWARRIRIKGAVRKITSRAQIYLQTGLYIVLLGRLERKYCQQAEISFSYTIPKSVVYFYNAHPHVRTILRPPKTNTQTKQPKTLNMKTTASALKSKTCECKTICRLETNAGFSSPLLCKVWGRKFGFWP